MIMFINQGPIFIQASGKIIPSPFFSDQKIIVCLFPAGNEQGFSNHN
jgi:hypothetical protein